MIEPTKSTNFDKLMDKLEAKFDAHPIKFLLILGLCSVLSGVAGWTLFFYGVYLFASAIGLVK
jgi:hypothetical protein